MATATAPKSILARITKGEANRAMKVLLFGTEGIGKTTFAAGAPSPVFICAEDGMPPALSEIPRIMVSSFAELIETVRELKESNHEFKSVVIDTMTAVEQLIHSHIITEHKEPSIEAFGYGKGYTMAVEKLNLLLNQLALLHQQRSMNIVLLGHSQVKSFNNLEGDNYDRYQLRCNDRFAGALLAWPDEVLFAKYDVILKKTSAKAKPKAIGEGRIICTQKTAVYDAKNRHNLPSTLPLSWNEFERAWRAGGDPNQPASPDTVEWIVNSWPLVRWAEGQEAKALEWLGIEAPTVESLSAIPEPKLRSLQDRMNQLIAKEESDNAAA